MKNGCRENEALRLKTAKETYLVAHVIDVNVIDLSGGHSPYVANVSITHTHNIITKMGVNHLPTKHESSHTCTMLHYIDLILLNAIDVL